MGADLPQGDVGRIDPAVELEPFPNTPPTNKQLAADTTGIKSPRSALAISCVLNTIELLEQILESCVMLDLLTRLPRVSSSWKRVIDNSIHIQHYLFFTPGSEEDYPDRSYFINPFLVYLMQYEGEKIEKRGYPRICRSWGPNAKKSGEEKSADEANWYGEIEYEISPILVLNWRRIRSDPRFMYERASWRRMLPIQPPRREVWTFDCLRDNTEGEKRMRSIREKGKSLGEIYRDVTLLEEDPSHPWTATYVRGSERYGAMTQIDITFQSLPEDNLIETGESYIDKLQGMVRWHGLPSGVPSTVVFEAWGKTPWLDVRNVESHPRGWDS